MPQYEPDYVSGLSSQIDSILWLFLKHNDINLEGYISNMLRKKIDENAAFPVANFIGIILGFISLSAFFIMQSLTVLLPLLFAPMVCITLSYLLYVSHRSTVNADSEVTVNPVRVDLL